MTRKHFELFAAMLRNVPSTALRLEFAATLIPVLKESNPNFKEDTFRKAANCQIDRKGC
jgi:hypothetical protein